jgi:hypothetical protein
VLAAQTDSPTVVAIFSQALKNVSEGRLRTFFNPAASPYGEEIELMHAGVRGAVHLAAIPTSALASALALAEALAARAPFPTASQLSGLTQQQHARWQAAWQIVANHVDTPAND